MQQSIATLTLPRGASLLLFYNTRQVWPVQGKVSRAKLSTNQSLLLRFREAVGDNRLLRRRKPFEQGKGRLPKHGDATCLKL